MVQIFKAGKAKKKATASSCKHIEIQSVDHEGVGVCRQTASTLFVEGALPGEVCDVAVHQSKNRFQRGRVSKVHQASALRRTPFCSYVSQCGGCQNQHVASEDLLRLKQQAISELMQRVGGIDTLPWQAPLNSKEQGYRRKARLAIDAQKKGSLHLGFRGQNNRVIDIEQCPVLTSVLSGMMPKLRAVVAQLAQPKALGHVSLIDAEPQPLVVMRVTRDLSNADRKLLADWAQTQGTRLVLESAKNQFELLNGDCTEPVQSYFTLEDGSRLGFMPNDFVQVNGEMNQRMIAQALEWLSPSADDRVLDLYCGMGNFSLPLARVCHSVTGVEGVDEMVQRAGDNARANGLDNARFEQMDLNRDASLEVLARQRWDLILLDPARAGAFELMAQLPKLSAKKILYVSCNPATFARDAAELVKSQYGLTRIGLMDMFPGTSHTEVMALFEPV